MSSPARIAVYGSEHCSYCTAARMLLNKKGLQFDDILVSQDPAQRAVMEQRSGRRSVPQVFIDGKPIGGFDELYTLEQSGELDLMLKR